MEDEHEMSGLTARRKKSPISLSSCFNTNQHRRSSSFDATTNSSLSSSSPRRSTSTWIKSKTNDLPEIKGKCRNFISRMGRHRRHSSAEFSYDPLSYALNFDQENPPSDDETRARSRKFDRQFPRTPSQPDLWKIPESPTLEAMAAGNDELRRGFEALSESMRRNKEEITSQEEEEEGRRSQVVSSSNRKVVVQFC